MLALKEKKVHRCVQDWTHVHSEWRWFCWLIYKEHHTNFSKRPFFNMPSMASTHFGFIWYNRASGLERLRKIQRIPSHGSLLYAIPVAFSLQILFNNLEVFVIEMKPSLRHVKAGPKNYNLPITANLYTQQLTARTPYIILLRKLIWLAIPLRWYVWTPYTSLPRKRTNLQCYVG